MILLLREEAEASIGRFESDAHRTNDVAGMVTLLLHDTIVVHDMLRPYDRGKDAKLSQSHSYLLVGEP